MGEFAASIRAMKATLPLFVLLISPFVCAQTTTDKIPPRVLRTAEIMGVRAEVEALAAIRSTPQHDELREMGVGQRLQGVVVATALDVESVNARIDYETARLQEVQGYLSAKRDRRLNLLSVGNIVIGTGVGAVGSGLQLITSAQHAGNIVSTSAGVGGTFLSFLGLRQPKGIMRAPGYTPAMLAKVLGKNPPAESDYPEVVWKYLATPDPQLPRGESGVEHLKFEWTSFGHLKEKPSAKEIDALTSTGKGGAPLSIDAIGDRTAMLADLRAHVSAMQVDLAELMRWVAGSR